MVCSKAAIYLARAAAVAILSLLLLTIQLPSVHGATFFHRHYEPEYTELVTTAVLRRNYEIDMSVRELAFLINGINASKGFLEFGGSGVSKLACVLMKNKSHVIIDSIAHYALKNLKDHSCLKQTKLHASSSVITLLDMGPVDATGFPTSTAQQKQWSKYTSLVQKSKALPIDTVLIGMMMNWHDLFTCLQSITVLHSMLLLTLIH
jgi:hypothetical protein